MRDTELVALRAENARLKEEQAQQEINQDEIVKRAREDRDQAIARFENITYNLLAPDNVYCYLLLINVTILSLLNRFTHCSSIIVSFTVISFLLLFLLLVIVINIVVADTIWATTLLIAITNITIIALLVILLLLFILVLLNNFQIIY